MFASGNGERVAGDLRMGGPLDEATWEAFVRRRLNLEGGCCEFFGVAPMDAGIEGQFGGRGTEQTINHTYRQFDKHQRLKNGRPVAEEGV